MTDKKIIVSLGGNVDSAVKGEYSIDVKAVLTEAWQHTLQSRMSINVGLFFILVFGVIVSFIASSFWGGIELVINDPELLQMVNIIVTLAVWPFIAGIEMMGIFHAIKKPTNIKMIFSFLHRGSWVALSALLTSVLISLGFQLLIIPGILLGVLLSLTVPLVVEKRLSPMQAIILSVKALRFKVLPLLAIYAVLFMTLMALVLPISLFIESSLAPIGIMASLFGLSFLVPWYYNVKGILYREIFGVYVDAATISNDLSGTIKKDTVNTDSDDIFSA